MVKTACMSEKKQPRKSTQINIRLPEGVKDDFQRAADDLGMSMSELIRFLIFEEVRHVQRHGSTSDELKNGVQRLKDAEASEE